MPSVTPERPHKRRRRRDRSSSSGSDHSVKRSAKHASDSHRKRNDRHERDSGSRNKDDKRPRREDQGNDHYRSRRDRSRSRSKSRERQRSKQRSHASRRRSGEREKESRIDPSRVVIKQEALSDDEDQRRQNRRREHERATVDMESGPNVSIKSENDDKKNVKEDEKPKEKPNFKPSGKLAEDTNVFNGVVVKYNEPPEAKKPVKRWRLYGFKGEEALPMLPIHRQSAYLLGRERKVADIPIDHPSCSKQHAVLQFRALTYKREDGTSGKRVRPYVIDLESSNGTFVNNQKIDTRRYVELFEKDVLKFGFSSREYVLLHEGSMNDEAQDDELNAEEESGEAQTEDAEKND